MRSTLIKCKQVELHTSKENCTVQWHLCEHARRETCHRDEQQLQPTCCIHDPGSGRHGGTVPQSFTLVDPCRCHYMSKFFSVTDLPRGEVISFQLLCIHSHSKDRVFSWGISPDFTIADNLLKNVQPLPYVKVNPRGRCPGEHYAKLRPQLNKSQTTNPGESGDHVLAGKLEAGNDIV